MKQPSKIEMFWSFTGPFSQPARESGSPDTFFSFELVRINSGHHSPCWRTSLTIFNFQLFEIEYSNMHHLDCADDCHKL